MIRNAVWFAFFSALTFSLLLIFAAKDAYVIYANWFQGGIAYEGETRAKFFFRFLITVVTPISLMLGALGAWIVDQLRKLQ
jgi:hypothetical protein